MKPQTFRFCSRLPVSAEQAFAWHERPDAFERLSPPWQPVEVIDQQGTIHEGDSIALRLWIGPVPIEWDLVHREYFPGRLFTDEQVRGPFSFWKHYHHFHAESEGSCILEDEIVFLLPLDRLSRPFLRDRLRRDLGRLFCYRHRLTRQALLHETGSA